MIDSNTHRTFQRAQAEATRLRAEITHLQAAQEALAKVMAGPAQALGLDAQWSRPRTVRSVFERLGWPEPERLSGRQWTVLRDHLVAHGIEVQELEPIDVDARLRLRLAPSPLGPAP